MIQDAWFCNECKKAVSPLLDLVRDIFHAMTNEEWIAYRATRP